MNSEPKPLTVFHLVSLMGMGGRAATALRQIRLLSGRGNKVLVGCIAGSAVETRCREMGIEVFSDFQFKRGFRPAMFLGDCRRLASRCERYNVDVVHAHLSQESWVACIGARLNVRPPAVVRSRGVVVPVNPHFFNRMMHNRYTNALIAPSKTIYDHLRSLPGFNPEKVHLIPDGVDIARFTPSTDTAIRDEFKISADAPLVAMVARLEHVKGHAVFFKALKLMSAVLPELRAICACDERTPGAYQVTVAKARKLGVSESVLAFTGMRADVEKIIATANVIALPSLGSEGSSRIALESAASGVPIVASSVGCLPEVVESGVTGLLVPPGEPQALANALLKLLKDPSKAKEMGAAARKRAETLYDEKLMVERLEQLYREHVPDRSL